MHEKLRGMSPIYREGSGGSPTIAPMEMNRKRLKALGCTIAYERSRQNMTQHELAKRVGLADHSHISRIECGRKQPSLALLLDIAEVLDVNVNRLFTRL